MSEKIKILWINPTNCPSFDEHIKKILESIKRPDTIVDVTHISRGPEQLEYWSNECVILCDLYKIIYESERQSYSSAVIGCFGDPGLRGARELAKIPVVGAGESCMHIASTLGHKFSIIASEKKAIPLIEDLVYQYGLEKKLASIRVVDFPPVRMLKEQVKLKEAIFHQAQKAIEEDNAEVIVLGCTCESGFSKDLMKKLKVPIVDAVVIPYKYAEMLGDLYHRLGLTHSKIYGYSSPPESELFLNYLNK